MQRRYRGALWCGRGERLFHIVLTVPAVRLLGVLDADVENVRGRVEDMVKAFHALRRRRVWRGGRGVYSVEVVWNEERQWLHVHLHVLTVGRGWWDLDGLQAAWREVCGRRGLEVRHRPHVQVADRGAVKEVLKYVTKTWELSDCALLVVMLALKGRRLLQGFGGIRVTADEEVVVCPGCGARFNRGTFEWRDVGEDEVWFEVYEGPYWADYWEWGENRLILRKNWARAAKRLDKVVSVV